MCVKAREPVGVLARMRAQARVWVRAWVWARFEGGWFEDLGEGMGVVVVEDAVDV